MAGDCCEGDRFGWGRFCGETGMAGEGFAGRPAWPAKGLKG